MSKKNINFDTFNARYNKDINKLLGLYQDILNIMEFVKSKENLIISKNGNYDLSLIIEKYNEFIYLMNYFFEKINEDLNINKPELNLLDVKLYKDIDEKSSEFILNKISLNINYLLLKYHEIMISINKLKLDDFL